MQSLRNTNVSYIDSALHISLGPQRSKGSKLYAIKWVKLILGHRVPRSAEFWKHKVLSGGIQRCAWPRHCHWSEEKKILNISFLQVGIEPTSCRVYSHTLVPLRHDWTH